MATEIAEKESGFRYLYPDDMPLWDKVRTIAQSLYGAQGIIADKKVRDQFAELQKNGFGHYPVCMAKTQYSFSTDPNLKGAVSNHVVPVRELETLNVSLPPPPAIRIDKSVVVLITPLIRTAIPPPAQLKMSMTSLPVVPL